MMVRVLQAAVLLLGLFAFPGGIAMAEEVRVVDGDGLRVGSEVIRLWGIDAPERDQTCTVEEAVHPCGEDATFLLGALVMQGNLTCETQDTDRYGRTVARCFAGGRDLAGEMVRHGYALDWPRYSNGFYAAQEQEAREHGRGMWAGEFVKPWEWRRR